MAVPAPIRLSIALTGCGPIEQTVAVLQALLEDTPRRVVPHALYATGRDVLPAALVAAGLSDGLAPSKIGTKLHRFMDGLGRSAVLGPFDFRYAQDFTDLSPVDSEAALAVEPPALPETVWREAVIEALAGAAGNATAADTAVQRIQGLAISVIDLRAGMPVTLNPPHDLDRLMVATINPLQFPPRACSGVLAGHSAHLCAHGLIEAAAADHRCDAVLVIRNGAHPAFVRSDIVADEAMRRAEATVIRAIEMANNRARLTGLGPSVLDGSARTLPEEEADIMAPVMRLITRARG